MKAIEIGTSKSCIAYEEADDIKIIQNALGEGIVPSVASISKNKILIGEDANIQTYLILKLLFQKQKDFQVKFIQNDLLEEENKPILIKIDEKLFSPEEIYEYIIQKLIKNGNKFNIYTNKAIITIPGCFGLVKRKLYMHKLYLIIHL